MILKDFAEKYSLDAQELLDILKFEKFLFESIYENVDPEICEYLLEYTKQHSKKGIRTKKNNNKVFGPASQSQKSEKRELKDLFFPSASTTIESCTRSSDVKASDIIYFFLKKGNLYSTKQILSSKEIEELSMYFNIPIKSEAKCNELANKSFTTEKNNANKLIKNNFKIRAPIVVVVGHVDHGKTTLLDSLRKKDTASLEKGGITQSIGAYVTKINNDEIVFIDTPGHEAFRELRSRGLTIADIAILVIAIDDGVKPQTLESIKMLKESSLQTIIAITKTDKIKKEKDSEDLCKKIYQQLAEVNLLVEDWGGEIPVVKVSSTKNEGIDNLVRNIIEYSSVMEIKTDTSASALGYIIESKIEKGLGATATVILHSGTLNIGDFFYAGSSHGKASFMFDSNLKRLNSITSPYPFTLGNFDSLPKPGTILFVDTFKKVKEKAYENLKAENAKRTNINNYIFLREKNLKNIILKAKNFSTIETLINIINSFQGKLNCDVKIISASVGNINKNDIDLSKTTDSYIFGFEVEADSEIQMYLKQNNTKILLFDVIYHLVEKIEEILSKKEIVKFLEKIGEAVVLKVFNIKNIGIIAGFKMLDGFMKKGLKIHVIRERKKVGEGTVKSLQKEREFVKEVTKGFEGAISVDGFSAWEEEDKIEIFEIKEREE
jgi:translation initiation factor IF-2